MNGASAFTPVAVIRDADPARWLVVGNDFDGPKLRRCKLDGTGCDEVAIGLGSVDAAMFDSGTNKIVVVTSTGAVFACNFDGASCAAASVPGTAARNAGAVVLDPVGQKILKRGCGEVLRCAPDGTGCTPAVTVDKRLVPPTNACGGHVDFVVEESTQKLIVASAPTFGPNPSAEIHLTQCNLDGSNCQKRVIHTNGLYYLPLVKVDSTRQQLVVVAHRDNHLTGNPLLVRCNLDGTGCFTTEVGGLADFHPRSLAVGTNEIVFAGVYHSDTVMPPLADWQFLARCAVDGTRCERMKAFPNALQDTMPSVLEAGADGVLVAGHRFDATVERDVVVRHPLDGSATSTIDMTLRPGRIALLDAFVDPLGQKLYTLSTGGHNRPSGIVSRCELDGSGCTTSSMPHAAHLIGIVGDRLLADALIAQRAGGTIEWFWRCATDGTTCAKTAFDRVTRGFTSYVVDAPNERLLEISYGRHVEVWDAVTTTRMSRADFPLGLAYAWRGGPHVAFDGTHLYTVLADANVARCTLEGACTSHPVAGAVSAPWRSYAAVVGGELYVVKSTGPDVDGPIELTRCTKDLTTCKHATLVSGGTGRRIHHFSVAIDDVRERLLVVTEDDVHARRATLIACDLAGDACKEAEITNVAVRTPTVMLHPNGDALVVAERTARPVLFSVHFM